MSGMLSLMYVQSLFQFGAKVGKWEGYYGDKSYLDMFFCKLFGIKLKCLRCFGLGERFLAYGCSIWFLAVDHMLLKCLFFVGRTPFIRCNMWPLTVCTFGFPCFLVRASFMGMTHHRSNISALTHSFWPNYRNFGSWSTAWPKQVCEILSPGIRYLLCYKLNFGKVKPRLRQGR